MSRNIKMVYTAVTIALFAIFLSVFFSHLPGKPNPVIAQQPDVAMAAAYAGEPLNQQQISVVVRNGDIIIPLPVVLDRKIVAFDYQTASTTIPLLAYINTQGKLVTAIRLCEPCNSKTFRIEGTELACGNCDTRWKLDNLEGLQGNCMKYPPDPIPSTVDGNEIHINGNVVKNWKIRL